jgi:hypothetical protein
MRISYDLPGFDFLVVRLVEVAFICLFLFPVIRECRLWGQKQY